MADQLKLRGGPTAEAQVFVGAEREVTVDTGLKALRIHDGVTPGGHLVELSTNATSSRSVAAASNETAREAIRVALEAAIATAESNRASAITNVETTLATGDSTTLASANTYTDTAISNLLGGSPDLLNTLNELAEAIGDDADFITTITTQITTEAARVDALIASDMWLYSDQSAFPAAASNHGRVVHSHADGAQFYAHAGQWIKLANDSQVTAVQADVDANEASATSAIAAVAADLATEENARLSAVASEASSRQSADNALSTRVDALEADTTNATAVAAVQADVNQNEVDSDAADAALSGRLDVLEADDTTATALTAETAARIAGDASTLSSANSYTDTSISNLVNGADTALDTLKEIGDALAAGDTDVTTALTNQITTESTARTSADTALSGRLDTLETDPTTATAVTAAAATNAGLITAEENARIAADLAETTARTAAITAEATARASAISAETTARQNAVSTEEAARIAADNTLTTNLATTNTNLTATNTAFAAADANLQTQVDSVNTVEAEMEARNLRAGLCFGQLYVESLTVA